jgi:hypothetical protein
VCRWDVVPTAVHRLAVSRIAAALVACALSGAPRVAVTWTTADAQHPGARAHPCHCAAHAERSVCACPVCREAAPKRGAGLSCYTPACSNPEARIAAPPGGEVFVIPAVLALAAAERAEPVPHAGAAQRELSRRPETPPPKA